VGHVARLGERRVAFRVWWGNLWERDHLEDSGVDGRITYFVSSEMGWGRELD
jgi:hypothetical protein